MRVNEGRWTSHVDGDFVVLLVGARATNPVHARKVRSLLRRMVRALERLERDPSTGLLGHQVHGGRHGLVVQYWRSVEALERFTRDSDDRDAAVWRAWFDEKAAHPASGFWHESFRVRAGEYHAAYADMPAIGLLRAGVPAPVGDRTRTLRDG